VHFSGIFSGLFTAVVVGALGRLVVRDSAPLGCLLTILVGLVGAGLGLALGSALNWDFWLTFAAQVVIAAFIVLPFSRLQHR
jgi:uncharacterized membrane protein YeaQ/YmgE (transglycosylase-associated protein family)